MLAFATISVSLVGLSTAFAAGFASFVTPCVFPLVPAYLSVVSGVAYQDLAENVRRVVASTALFVLGFTIIFSLYGSGVGYLGASFSTHRITIERVGGAFMILMGLVLFGFAARLFGREWRMRRRAHQATAVGAVLTGAAFAIGWTPCITPVLSGILTVAAASSSPAKGGALLAAYSLGLGVPFLISGVAMTSTLGVLGVFRRYGAWVNRVSGVVLIVMGVLLASGELTRITAQLAS
jgi:cytochrome c-type biogenesis protein